MVQKRFYSIDELSTILGKTPASIHGHLARKQYDAVPPPIKLGRRLAWLVDSVELWIEQKANEVENIAYHPNVNKGAIRNKLGRPKKGEERKRRIG